MLKSSKDKLEPRIQNHGNSEKITEEDKGGRKFTRKAKKRGLSAGFNKAISF